MKTIWVTGSKGQLGTELSLQYKKLSGFNFIFTDIDELDLTHYKAVENFFEVNIPDVIVNCAAYTAVDKAETDIEKAFILNRDVPGILTKLSEKYNSTLIHVSTDYVFDGQSYIPYLETDKTNPQSVYGQSKLEGELKVLEGSNNLVIRTSWLYSAHGGNFVKTMLRLGKEKKVIQVVYDQIGSPTSATDLAEAILKIIEKSLNSKITKSEIYHYSNEGVCSWYDLAVEIMTSENLPCKVHPITSSEYPTIVKRPPYSVFNKLKIKKDFELEISHWRPSVEKVLTQIRNH